jgi:hypothetical protein
MGLVLLCLTVFTVGLCMGLWPALVTALVLIFFRWY